MAITESRRNDIYEFIKRMGNEQIANDMLSLLPPVGWADVATKTDLAALGRELRGEMAGLGRELRGEMAQVRGEVAELHGTIDRLDGSIDRMRFELRSEMHQSIRSQTWALVAWTTGWTTALAGLIVALGR